MRPGRSGEPLRRKLVLAYDGTDFAGWQVQVDRPTIQGTLQAALSTLLGETVAVHGAGRTDAGVHALGQVCHFDDPRGWSNERLAGALNAALPPTIRVREAAIAAPGFHALHDARRKTYVYQFQLVRPAGGQRATRASIPPLLRRTHLAVGDDLDLLAMRAAAGRLVGRKDFTALSKAMPPGRSTIKTVAAVRLLRSRRSLRLVVTGEGFLYGMVRLMGGLLLEVGQGRRSADELPSLLASGDRARAAAALPAHGLLLWRVDYGGPEHGVARASLLS